MRNPDPRIKPPLGSYIDWSHPLAEGLVGCWLFNEGSGRATCNLVAPDNVARIGSSFEWHNDFLRAGSTYNDANNKIYCGFYLDPRNWSGITILAKCFFRSNLSNQWPPTVINAIPYGTYGNYIFSIEQENILVWRPGYSSYNLFDDNNPKYLGLHTLAVDWYLGTGNGRCFYDGKLNLTGNKKASWSNDNYPTYINWFERPEGSFRGAHHDYYHVLIFNQIISPEKHEWLQYEPYSFILWPSQTSIFDLGAGGGTSLSFDNITHSQIILSPTLAQFQVLLTGNVDQAQLLDSIGLSQLHPIDPSNVGQSQAVSLISLLQNSIVTVSSASQAQSIESPSLAQIAELITSSISQPQSVDNIEITIQGGLSIYSVGQTQIVNSLGLAQVISLVTNTVSQAQSVDSLTITLTGGLSIDSLMQGQSIGALSLAQVIALTINQIAQAQNIDQVNLSTNFVLDINGVTTSQTVLGPITLSQISEILTSDLLQGQTIASISFSGVKGIVTVTFKAKAPKVEFKPKGSNMSFH